MSEATVQAKIVALLRSRGAKVIKIHGDAYMESGTPDLIACLHGRFIAIEVKAPHGGVISPIQHQRMREWRVAGAIGIFARSWQEVETALVAEGL